MKIRVHFYYTKYKNSKLATFLSKLKSGIYGFLAWLGFFMVPFGFAGHIGSMHGCAQTALTIVAVVAFVSYFLLFLIDESKLAERKTRKIEQKDRKVDPPPKATKDSHEDLKYTYSKIIPDSMIDFSIEEYRHKHILNALNLCEKTMLALNLHDEFLSTREEIIISFNNDLMIFESLYGKNLYLDNSTYYADFVDNLPKKALGISIYSSLLKSNYVGIRPGIIIEYIPQILLSEFDSPSTKLFDMSKEEIKRFLIAKINKKL